MSRREPTRENPTCADSTTTLLRNNVAIGRGKADGSQSHLFRTEYCTQTTLSQSILLGLVARKPGGKAGQGSATFSKRLPSRVPKAQIVTLAIALNNMSCGKRIHFRNLQQSLDVATGARTQLPPVQRASFVPFTTHTLEQGRPQVQDPVVMLNFQSMTTQARFQGARMLQRMLHRIKIRSDTRLLGSERSAEGHIKRGISAEAAGVSPLIGSKSTVQEPATFGALSANKGPNRENSLKILER